MCLEAQGSESQVRSCSKVWGFDSKGRNMRQVPSDSQLSRQCYSDPSESGVLQQRELDGLTSQKESKGLWDVFKR